MVALGELAKLVGGELKGPGDPARLEITGTSSVDGFSPGRICYARSARYLKALEQHENLVVLMPSSLADGAPLTDSATLLLVDEVVEAFIAIQDYFYGQPRPASPGISPAAFVHPDAGVHDTASVDPGATIAAGAVVGEGVRIGPNVAVMEDARIGDSSVLHPGVVIYPGTVIGNDCVLHAGVVLGTDGFRFEQWPERKLVKKLVHAGAVRIGDRVEIGANSTVDRATFEGEFTELADDVKLDDQVHIGHNARVGSRTTIAAQSCLSGSVVIEEDAWVGAAATISQGVVIGTGARVLINAVVVRDVEPGAVMSGFYAMPHRDWKRAFARLSRAE